MSLLAKLGFGPLIDKIGPTEAHQGQCQGDLILIDVRDPDEWNQTGTPQGAHRISMSDDGFLEAVDGLLKSTGTSTIALSCRSGVRSGTAGKMLHKAGITNLRIVDGGVQRWLAEGLPVDT